MILGIGNDIIEISRIEKVIDQYGQKFLIKHFTQEEINYCKKFKDSARHFAGRFAAKEAIVKALGKGIGKEIGWLDFEILNDTKGKPVVHVKERQKERISDSQLLVSISHSKDYATAFAIWAHSS